MTLAQPALPTQLPLFTPRRRLGQTGFEVTRLGIGDLADASGDFDAQVGPFCDARYVDETLPLAKARGVGTVCFKTFGAGKLLGDTEGYSRPLQLRPEDLVDLRRRALDAVKGKGRVWWDPEQP